MADASVRLAGPVALGTTAATVYTVPAGKTAVIRTIHIANTGGSTQPVTISIGIDAPNKRIWPGRVCLPADVDSWSGNIPMATGEIIQAFAGNTSITLVIGGVES